MNEKDFNPNNPAASNANIFGLPYTANQAELVLLPVPFEATVSYGAGAAQGPAAIFDASMQVDLFHPLVPEVWKRKIAMEDEPEAITNLSNDARKKAEEIIDSLMTGKSVDEKLLKAVNDASEKMIAWVEERSANFLATNKTVGLIGGDHSTPLGLLNVLARNNQFAILQIDAHCDLRKAYEGFEYSHASIMYNALKNKNITGLTQVGIRDYCQEEIEYIGASRGRVRTFFDRDIQMAKIEGMPWAKECDRIIATLPDKVYISFDIDGLSPELCPNTGTPVPGGLSFAEAAFLIERVALHKKQIIGFDPNEVSPGKEGDWDANVGARLLFQLCCAYFINKEK